MQTRKDSDADQELALSNLFLTYFHTDIELGQLPRRETDNAIILANATRMYKLHAVPGEVKVVKR